MAILLLVQSGTGRDRWSDGGRQSVEQKGLRQGYNEVQDQNSETEGLPFISSGRD